MAKVEKSSARQQKIRSNLLKQYGIEALDSLEGKAFLNKIAEQLGFESAEALCENYIALPDNEDAFKKIQTAKNNFCQKAALQTDPVEAIKNLYTAEHQRLQK